MKKLALSLIGALSVLVLGGSAYAQAIHVRMDVPFDFSVNNKTLPAGQYDILSAGPTGGHSLEIRDSAGAVAYVLAADLESSTRSRETKLIFRRYGNSYLLSELWSEGIHAGWGFPRTRTEIQEAKKASGQQVIVAAKN